MATSLVGLGGLVVLGAAGLVAAHRRPQLDFAGLLVPVAVAVAAWLISVALSGPVGGTTAFSRGVRGLAPLSLALAAPCGLALALALRTQTRRLATVAVAAVAGWCRSRRRPRRPGRCTASWPRAPRFRCSPAPP